MTMECPDPVIIPPTCNILCASSVLPGSCDTAYFWEASTHAFTMPTVGGSGVLTVCNSAQYALGANVWVAGLGYLTIIARPNTQTISVQNDGFYNNAAPGSVAAIGVPIVHCPPPVPDADPFAAWLEASEVWDPGSIADGDEEANDVAVPGAALGDFVLVSFSLDVADLCLTGQVTAADVVTVQLLNNTGGAVDLGSGTVYVRVIPRV